MESPAELQNDQTQMKKAVVYKLLIITDSTSAEHRYAALLPENEKYIFNIGIVNQVQEAYAVLENEHPNCILMDTLLDEDETVPFLQALKFSKSYRRYPVIFLANSNDAAIITKAYKLGVQDVLIQNELTAEWLGSSVLQVIKRNRFIEKLKDQRKILLDKNKELNEYKKYLEMRVMSRTAELKDSYEQLVEEMTIRKNLEEQLTARNKELDTFVYKASHDLRGPLASLMGVASIAKLDLTDPLAVRYLEMIEESAQKLNFTLFNLLEVTKIKYLDVEIKPVQLKEVIEESVDNYKEQLEAQQIQLTLSVDQQNDFFSDPYLLGILLQHLIENSILYKSPTNLPAFIAIDVKDAENGVEIIVTDNGQGIPKDVQNKVFDMFFRYNLEVKSKGSGLGLYIVKNCVDKLNGAVGLLSEPGIGTEVKIFLPSLKQ